MPVCKDGGMDVLSEPLELDVTVAGEVIDAAIATDVAQATFLLGSDGSLWHADHTSGAVESVGDVELPSLPENEPFCNRPARHRLHVSPSGRFLAVVVDYGRSGVLYDGETKSVTLEMQAREGRGYHVETVPFSAVFVIHEGREALIHRTEWNRLDASDAETGRLLTERGPTTHVNGEKPPPHYVDYFHGGLCLSPNGDLVLDDGWWWHPVGIPLVWSVRTWLDSNVWESEDGPTKRGARHSYDWDEGSCWLDDDRLALQGFGDPEWPPSQGAAIVRYSDLMASGHAWGDSEGEHVHPVPGPEGRLFGHDDMLFAVTTTATVAWDVASGERLEEHEAFSPTVHSRGDRRLTEVSGSVLVSRTY